MFCSEKARKSRVSELPSRAREFREEKIRERRDRKKNYTAGEVETSWEYSSLHRDKNEEYGKCVLILKMKPHCDVLILPRKIESTSLS